MVLIAVVSISDIDECELGYNECTQLCVNFGGAYKCACEPDYQLGTDGKSCYRTSLLHSSAVLTAVCQLVCLFVRVIMDGFPSNFENTYIMNQTRVDYRPRWRRR